MKDVRATCPYDHYNAETAADPFPLLAKMRSECPVGYSDAHGGFWVLSKYGDIREVTRNTSEFSSRYGSVPRDVGFGDIQLLPLQLDPPEHSRMRRLLTPAFTPATAASLEKSTREFARSLLDEVTARGRFDASRDYARLIPTSVVCHVIGLPDALDQFSGWVESTLENAVDNFELAALAGMEMFAFLFDLVGKRALEPDDDIISLMLKSEIDGDCLSQEEVTMVTALLFLAGIDTTWRTLASAIHYLATHPNEQRMLRDHPERLECAREEFLRVFAPVSIARVVVQDVELGGQMLKEGEMIFLSLPSANRDEDQFADPDEVRLDRTENPHLAFGNGPHRCLGSSLARMELMVALEELLQRVPQFELSDPDSVTWTVGPVRGPRHVEIVF